MRWTVTFYSSFGSDFNYDFHVTLDEAVAPVEYNYRSKAELEHAGQPWAAEGEQPGTSVFLQNGDSIFHTYSSYARGGDLLLGTFNYLDLTPLGRQFHVGQALHHDEYDTWRGLAQPRDVSRSRAWLRSRRLAWSMSVPSARLAAGKGCWRRSPRLPPEAYRDHAARRAKAASLGGVAFAGSAAAGAALGVFTSSSRTSTDAPIHIVASFDHFVTQ